MTGPAPRSARGTARFVLDTQFYVDLLRGHADGAETLRFVATRAAVVDFHALVGAELLFGAGDAAASARIRQRVVDRFKPRRILVPDADDLLAAGDVIRALGERNGPHPEYARRNFWNDVVIAVSCRRHGRVLVSRDADHGRIRLVAGHRVLTRLPLSDVSHPRADP